MFKPTLVLSLMLHVALVAAGSRGSPSCTPTDVDALITSLGECSYVAAQQFPIPTDRMNDVKDALLSGAASNIVFSGTEILHGQFETLAAGIKGSSHLNAIVFWRNGLTSDDMPALVEALVANHRVSNLQMNDNVIGDHGAKVLLEAIPDTGIKSLSLTDNGLTPGVANDIRTALTKPHQLESLGITGMEDDDDKNILGDAGALAISDVLRFSPTISQLVLSGNEMTDIGVKAIADSLLESKVSQLSFHNNFVGDDGARFLAEAIAATTTLQLLVLTQNLITDEGVEYLSEALLKNKSLRTVDCARNPSISKRGYERLKLAIRRQALPPKSIKPAREEL